MTMISFIFLGILLQLFDGSGEGGQQIEVFGKSRRFGTIDSQTISVLHDNRQKLMDFYATLHQRLTVSAVPDSSDEAAAQARTAALNFLSQLANSYSRRATPQQLADNLLLAQYAQSQGIQVTQNDIVMFLTQLTGGMMTDAIFSEVLQVVGLNEKRLEYLISQDLLASRMRQSFEISVSGITPATQWDWFQRMNRQVTAEVAAVPVDRFVDSVGEPTEGQLQAFFDKHKAQPWDPTSADSGFVMPNKMAFQYVKAVPSKAMLDSVTDADIEKYYEANKQEKFLKPVRPIGERPALPGLPGQDSGSIFRPNLGGFTQSLSTPPQGGSIPSATPPASVSPAAENPEPQGPAPVEESEEPKTDAVPAEDKPVETSMNDIVQVSYQTEAASALATEPTAPEPKTEEPKTEEPAAVPVPTEAKTEPAPDATVDSTAESKPSDSTAIPATTVPALPEPETPIDLSILYRPLDEVKEEIRQTLAQEKAMQALAKIEERMREYSQIYNQYLDAEKEPPAAPDLKAIAAEQGLELVNVDLDTIYGAIKSDFARGMLERQKLFQLFDETQLLFQPESFSGDSANYLYWVTETVAEFKPAKLDDVREQVVQRWKETEAQTPALKQAEELATAARTAEKSLQDAFAGKLLSGNTPVSVVETEPFFWKSYGSGISPWMAILNGIPPMLGEVREKGVAAGDAEIDNKLIFAPGSEFMEKVYALQVGETVVVFNAPKTVAYVVRVTASSPSDEVLWERFQLANPMEYRLAGQMEMVTEAREAWMQTIYDETGFEWIKDPQSIYGE